MSVSEQQAAPAWLLLMFSLPTKRASERVDVWRKLRRYGALPLRSSGYLLPNNAANQEHFEWLAAAIRKYKGDASVVQVHAIDDLPAERLVQMFVEARSKDYEQLLREMKNPKSRNNLASLGRLRRRFQEIVTIDFFESPLRSRVEAWLMKVETPPAGRSRKVKREFLNRTWVTRPRPGIDRVSSAWLIRRFIDTNARFVFATDSKHTADAIPFDMFAAPKGFGHRGDDCTFETLHKEFGIRDAKITAIAEIVHDADLDDAKFGRTEGTGLDRVLIGWAQQGVSDEELMRRGMELIEGLYHSLSRH